MITELEVIKNNRNRGDKYVFNINGESELVGVVLTISTCHEYNYVEVLVYIPNGNKYVSVNLNGGNGKEDTWNLLDLKFKTVILQASYCPYLKQMKILFKGLHPLQCKVPDFADMQKDFLAQMIN